MTPRLHEQPLAIHAVEQAMSGLAAASPIDQRITACILGVPVTHGFSIEVDEENSPGDVGLPARGREN